MLVLFSSGEPRDLKRIRLQQIIKFLLPPTSLTSLLIHNRRRNTAESVTLDRIFQEAADAYGQEATYRARGRGRARTVPATKARDHDPRGGTTDSCTADAWRTVSSAASHPSPLTVPPLSSSSLENFARDQRIGGQVGRQAGEWAGG